MIPEEKNRNGKTVLYPSKIPVHKADSYSQAISEIPPSPPFSKGGLGGISAMGLPIDMASQNYEILPVHDVENGNACLQRGDRPTPNNWI